MPVRQLLLGAMVVATGTLPAQGTRPSAEAIARAVDSLAARVVASGVTPGMGVAVVMDGRTIYAKGHGWKDFTNRVPADDGTLWYLASSSKSLTGFGASLLSQQGAFRFSDPIGTLLPGVQWPAAVDANQLTLAHFLSHKHSLDDNAVVQSAAYTGAIPEAQWPSLIRHATKRNDTELVYSNFGYNVAAMVIDRKRPEGWKRFLDSAVYKPAGMNDTHARTSGLEARVARPHDFAPGTGFRTMPFQKRDITMNSAGGHVATLQDLARWAIVQMDGGMIDGKRVFPAEAVSLSHRMIAPQTRDQSKRFGYFDREGWSAGWDIGAYRGEKMVSRFGSYSATRSHLSFLPGRRIGVVAMNNGPLSTQPTDVIAAFLYDLEAGRSDARQVAAARVDSLIARLPRARAQTATSDSTRRSRQKPLSRPLADFVGSYAHEYYGTITFELREGALFYRWGVLEGPSEVYDAGTNVLRIEYAGMGTTVPFLFNGAGSARSIRLLGEPFVRR